MGSLEGRTNISLASLSQAISTGDRPAEVFCHGSERADPWQKTSAGRSPVEIACESDKFGSHREVCDILRGKVKLLPMREFLAWSS
ncbi:hypothetical protein AK812_SmicGene23142 [Symbiodinium microadriaticum]|uniref:Uncharacterized protein n=1 Tax=Symbiodinium microadriaticum TaxID=2951 RepID=A0A1Q9DHZ3_SYMMI|nr:hypothetical protein AK812_SmicGene23142 [Symbiodinium microadriaticum]